MALRLYKDPDQDPGEKVFLKSDPETREPIYAIVRRIGSDKLRDLQRPFERPHKRKGKQTRWRVPPKNQEAFSLAILDWAFRDIVNYEVRIPDSETASIFSGELGETVQADDVIKLDGRLTPQLKKLIVDSDIEINRAVNDAMGFSVEEEDNDEDVERERQEYLLGNSQTGSSSESNIATLPNPAASGVRSSDESGKIPANPAYRQRN